MRTENFFYFRSLCIGSEVEVDERGEKAKEVASSQGVEKYWKPPSVDPNPDHAMFLRMKQRLSQHSWIMIMIDVDVDCWVCWCEKVALSNYFPSACDVTRDSRWRTFRCDRQTAAQYFEFLIFTVNVGTLFTHDVWTRCYIRPLRPRRALAIFYHIERSSLKSVSQSHGTSSWGCETGDSIPLFSLHQSSPQQPPIIHQNDCRRVVSVCVCASRALDTR